MSSEIDSLAGLAVDATVLFVGVPATSRRLGVDDVIAELPEHALRNTMTILGLHATAREELDEDVLNDIWGRVSGVPLYVLQHDSDGVPRLKHTCGEAIADLDGTGLVAAVRQADVMAVLMAPGSYLPNAERLHYEGPNGSHYGAFLRPGFALTSNHRLDRISFWLTPLLRNRTSIVVDHWSMLALARHAAAYAARVFGPGAEVFVEALRGYEEREVLTSRFSRALPPSDPGSAVFLLSINSSGHLAHDVVLPALRYAGHEDASCVALAAAPDPGQEVEALAALDGSFARHAASACLHCQDSKMVLPIERDTFLLKLAAYTMYTAITRRDTDASTPLIEAYRGIGAFSLHRDYEESGAQRHHAFYVDVTPMLDRPRFRKRLLTAVGSLADIDPTVIVCPPSSAAVALAEQVARLLEIDQIVQTEERGIAGLGEDDRNRLTEAAEILLVDDVVITGGRIKGFRQELITLKRNSGHSGEFVFGCLAGVARARDAQLLRACADTVHHRDGSNNTFAAVETLFLPNWDERSCPWCLELRTLQRPVVTALGSELVERRVDQLSAITGLLDPFFTLPGDHVSSNDTSVVVEDDVAPASESVGPLAAVERTEQPAPASQSAERGDTGTAAVIVHRDESAATPARATPPIDETAWREMSEMSDNTAQYAGQFWELNPGSVFGEVQGVDLVTSIAAAVNTLRSTSTGTPGRTQPSRLDEVFRPPVSKVLHPDLYVSGRFYEPALLAGILRVCHEWDLRAPDTDAHLETGMKSQLEYLSSGRQFLAEAVIAASSGMVPRGPVLEIAAGHDSVEELARVLLT